MSDARAVAEGLSEMRCRILIALCAAPHSEGAWDLAYRAGYRPSKNYRVAASKALHTLCDKGLAIRARPAEGIGATQKFYATSLGRSISKILEDSPHER